jgi:hypothetical protein
MSTDQAYEILGVKAGASFEQIMTAKNKLLAKAGSNTDRRTEVEQAYDILLMQAMKRRLTGEGVGANVRFADVAPKRSAGQVATKVLKTLPGGVQLSRPAQKDIAAQSALFAGLAAWALIQGLTEPAVVAQTDVPGLQLAAGTFASVYLLRDRKKVGLARALGLTAAGLTLGALLGGAIQNYLHVEIVPLGGLNSPGIFVSEFALAGLWAAATFLA